jgi:hypothetical protein
MPDHFIEIPTSLVHEDPRYPDQDNRHIYEHLRHFCSKFFPLPAVSVKLTGGKLIVTEGHKYLRAARELGYPWLRAIYESRFCEPGAILKELPSGVKLTSHEVLEREMAAAVVRGYHVYFFDGALTCLEQERFRREIAGFFERLDTLLIASEQERVFACEFPFKKTCAEFEALIPVGDPSWARSYLEVSRGFSQDVKRIISFQGARFPG